MTIEKPSSGATIEASWGIDVANAINRIGVGLMGASAFPVVVQPGSTAILKFEDAIQNARLFLKDDGTVEVTEGRRGVYVVSAYLATKGLADGGWGRAYLYRNGVSFAGNSIVGAGGTGVPLNVTGIDAFDEGDAVTVRCSFEAETEVTLVSMSMVRIAENT